MDPWAETSAGVWTIDDESQNPISHSNETLPIQQSGFTEDELAVETMTTLETTQPFQFTSNQEIKDVYPNVTVDAPQKVGDNLQSYVVYRITFAASAMHRFPPVLRRYSDFVYLFEHLANLYPGACIPPLPSKNAMGRFQEAFIERRRVALSLAVNDLVRHPLLGNDQHVQAFVTHEDWSAHVKLWKIQQDASGTMVQRLVGLAFNKDAVPTPEEEAAAWQESASIRLGDESDHWSTEKLVRLDGLLQHCQSLFKLLESLAQQRQDVSNSALQLSDALHHLSSADLPSKLTRRLIAHAQHHRQHQQIDAFLKADTECLTDHIDYMIKMTLQLKKSVQGRKSAYEEVVRAKKDVIKKRGLKLDPTTQREVYQAMKQCTIKQQHLEKWDSALRPDLDRFDQHILLIWRQSIRQWLERLLQIHKQRMILWQNLEKETQSLVSPT